MMTRCKLVVLAAIPWIDLQLQTFLTLCLLALSISGTVRPAAPSLI
jgi:hypothetical protein